MSFVDDDLGSFFSGLDEVTVAFGGTTAQGHFNAPAGIFATGKIGGMESQQRCIDLPADAFSPMPLPKQAIVVTSDLAGAVTYNVVDRKFSEDGRIVTYELAL